MTYNHASLTRIIMRGLNVPPSNSRKEDDMRSIYYFKFDHRNDRRPINKYDGYCTVRL